MEKKDYYDMHNKILYRVYRVNENENKISEIDGLATRYWPNGQVEDYERYENGHLNGEAQYFWSNGNLMMMGAYCNGEPIGQWRYYSEKDGSFSRAETFII